MKRALLVVGALGAVWLALELLVHLAPSLLPRSYLAGFPGNGCEFFHPDVFERTPVEGVLLPHLASAHRGPPPADLIELGIAPRSADDDARAFPEIELPADARGFPNARELARCDLLLIGDSFGVAAGALRPEGLQAALARATGRVVHNLSLAGIGPVQERWLLETVGLPEKPRAVLWLYYSGNDLTASYEALLARRDGRATWAEAWPHLRKPRAILLDVFTRLLRPAPSVPCHEPLPGFRFTRADGSVQALWFEPESLRQLGWSRAEWEAHPAWVPVQAELRAARAACAAQGARMLLVYLPSKPEVLLPCVARDAELAQRALAALGNAAPAGDAEELFERLLGQRRAQEELLRDFCARAAIPFLSAVPALAAQAARGELGYLVTDTHWQSLGQAALLEPLLDFLRREGLFD